MRVATKMGGWLAVLCCAVLLSVVAMTIFSSWHQQVAASVSPVAERSKDTTRTATTKRETEKGMK
jgi:hypothetical protein